MPFELTPMIEADLKAFAKNLPDIGLDLKHETEMIKRYKDGGWGYVNMYVDFVLTYYGSNQPNKTFRESFGDWWERILENGKQFLDGAKKRVL